MAGDGALPYPATAYTNSESPPSPPPGPRINWNLMEANDEGNLAMSADDRSVAFIAHQILDRYDLPVSDDEFEERSDAEESQSEHEPEVIDETATNRFWFPWPDRITCTLDILMHLPRSVFSQKQLDLFLWLLKVNNVDDVPSIKQMQKINLALQKVCGIETIPYNGALGHKYFVNNLAQIIAQEMANPRDSGPKLSEARQGQRWLNELPPEQTTPMLRISGQDYYIYEPAMLDSEEPEFCIPIRWFVRGEEFFAKCWKMTIVSSDKGAGWRVLKSDNYEVPAHRFLKNLIQFQADATLYNVPHPSHIIDVLDPSTNKGKPWEYTDPIVGNSWRAKAKGSRVGNVSKKWNEHDSFLMTPAGLPREEAQKEYNIHFLCTSNLARPLEMLDGIVEQLEAGQGEGIWVWDIELNEPVLVIPEVLALLGDNPMQSEFACHIGLRGKLFSDGESVAGSGGSEGSVAGSGLGSDQGSIAGSEGSVEGQQKTGKGKKKLRESMRQMVDRVTSFMKIGKLRNKEETTEKLSSFFTDASTKLDTKTKVKKSRTEHGLKDKFQMQAALDAAVAALPEDTTSPVWRIKGHPVEILHVVLLGFQLKGKDDKKELLTTRLSSLDVSGLGISPLAGRTLVQYSGSLTGRDFRAIAQTLLTQEIDHFLLCTAQWTNRWFNKPKFHIFLHLPAHIRRFGPAILFATEAFESFNAIIRAKSVHSNRHAPSRDIAQAFAQGNRIRHLLSGGLFVLHTRLIPSDIESQSSQPQPARSTFAREKSAWRKIGDGPARLISGRSTVTHYLGLDEKRKPTAGISVVDKAAPRVIEQTFTGQHIFSWSKKPGLFQTNQQVYLSNGDVHPERVGETFVARVEEIIQQPDGILLQKAIDLLCTVNVQHNCLDNHCAATAMIPVFQERTETTQTAARVAHAQNENDIVLNTAQMRDAAHIQKFRLDSTPMDLSIVVHQSAAKELASRKARTQTAEKTTASLILYLRLCQCQFPLRLELPHKGVLGVP
ncbi:hypothetical protein B0H13DRAFT_2228460 [Mycena leptocephala]|nr:hypothetical protein B0H13DRAFT_2228460 [Mycena leptocephala]